jgi:hypothetical protein
MDTLSAEQHQALCPPDDEQALFYQEVEAEREEALRQEGARKALKELQLYLMHCACQDGCNDEFKGLRWSIDAITRRLSDITEKGGAL